MKDYPGRVGFKHPRKWSEIASDFVHIVDGYCQRKHNNGVACSWGGALCRLAGDLVQQSTRFEQRDLRGTGVDMGGYGHSSKYNTRLMYASPLGDIPRDNPLEDNTWRHFDVLFQQYMKKRVEKKRAVPTTQIRHDYGIFWQEMPLFVCEAKSVTLEEEKIKVLMGMARILTYSDIAYGMVTTKSSFTIYKAILDTENNDGEIKFKHWKEPYTTSGLPRINYIQGVEKLIKKVARIHYEMEHFLPAMFDKQQELTFDHPGCSTRGVDNDHKRRNVPMYDATCFTGLDVNILREFPTDFIEEVHVPARAAYMDSVRKQNTRYTVQNEYTTAKHRKLEHGTPKK